MSNFLKILTEVKHPGKGDRNIVDLEMVKDIDRDGSKVTVTLAFPKRRDPLAEYLIGSTRAAIIRNCPDVTEVEVKTIVEEAPATKKNFFIKQRTKTICRYNDFPPPSH